jgi:hypothetical protein
MFIPGMRTIAKGCSSVVVRSTELLPSAASNWHISPSPSSYKDNTYVVMIKLYRYGPVKRDRNHLERQIIELSPLIRTSREPVPNETNLLFEVFFW